MVICDGHAVLIYLLCLLLLLLSLELELLLLFLGDPVFELTVFLDPGHCIMLQEQVERRVIKRCVRKVRKRVQDFFCEPTKADLEILSPINLGTQLNKLSSVE